MARRRRGRQFTNRMVPGHQKGHPYTDALLSNIHGDPISGGPYDSGFPRVPVAPPSGTQYILPGMATQLVSPKAPTVGTGGGGNPWPDTFMSYTSSGPISLNDVHGTSPEDPYIIEYLSFEGLERPNPRPITLEDCSNILIRRIDTRKCTMGLLYALNCQNITMEYCRAENIGYEFLGEAFPGNDNDLNLYQLNNVDGFLIHDIKGRYGNTEDVISHYGSHNGEVYNIEWEGAISASAPTSDSSASVQWESDSGTGAILGDLDGSGLWVHDCTFLNPGQVGLAIASGTNCYFEDCIVYSEGNSAIGGAENIAAYIWNQYTTCSAVGMINCRGYFQNENSFWDGGGCSSVDISGSDFLDNTLDPEDYRVTL